MTDGSVFIFAMFVYAHVYIQKFNGKGFFLETEEF